MICPSCERPTCNFNCTHRSVRSPSFRGVGLKVQGRKNLSTSGRRRKRTFESVDSLRSFPALGATQPLMVGARQTIPVDAVVKISPDDIVALDWKHDFCGFRTFQDRAPGFISRVTFGDSGFLVQIFNLDHSFINPTVWHENKLGQVKRSFTRFLDSLSAKPLHEALSIIDARRGLPGPPVIVHPAKKSKFQRASDKRESRALKQDKRSFLSFQMDQSIYDDDYVAPRRSRKRPFFSKYTLLRGANNFRAFSESISSWTHHMFIALTRLHTDYKEATRYVSLPGGFAKHFRRDIMVRAMLDFVRVIYQDASIVETVCRFIDMAFKHATPNLFLEFQAGGFNPLRGVNAPLFFMAAAPFLFKSSSPMGKFRNAMKNYREVGGYSDLSDTVHSVFNWFKWLLATGRDAFSEGSLRPFYRNGTSYLKWYDQTSDAIRLKNTIQLTGTPGDISDYMDRLSTLSNSGKVIVSQLKADGSPVYNVAQRLQDRLLDLIADEQLNARARELQTPPFAFGLYGSPAVGKTTLLDELILIFSKHSGDDYDPDRKFVRSSNDKFQSGLRNDHRYFVLDDVGSVNPNVNPEAASNTVSAFMEYFNTSAPATNQAALEDKGRIFARPDLVVLTSNVADFGTYRVSRANYAFFRRLKYRISLTVKPEFRVNLDCNELDPTKVPVGFSDIHTFTVVQYTGAPHGTSTTISANGSSIRDPQNDGSAVCETVVLANVGQLEFFTWYSKAVKAHLANVARLRSRNASMIKSELCDTCSMLSSRCECEVDVDTGVRFNPCFRCFEEHKHCVCDDELELPQQELVRLEAQGAGCSMPTSVETVRMEFWKAGQKFSKFRGLVSQLNEFLYHEYELYREFVKCMSTFVAYKISSLDMGPKVERPKPVLDKSKKALLQRPRVPTPASAPAESVTLAQQSSSYQNWLQVVKTASEDDTADIYSREESPDNFSFKDQTRTIGLDTLAKKVRKNMLRLEFSTTEDFREVDSVFGVVTHSRLVLTVCHAVADNVWVRFKLDDDSPWLVSRITDCLVNCSPNMDMVTLRYPGPRQFKSLLNFFAADFHGAPRTCDKVVNVGWSTDSFVPRSEFGVVDSDRESEIMLVCEGDLRAGSCGSFNVARVGAHVFIVSMHQYGCAERNLAVSRPLTVVMALGGHLALESLIPAKLDNAFKSNGLRLTKSKKFEAGVFHRKSFASHYAEHYPDLYSEFLKRITPLGTIAYGTTPPRSHVVATPLNGLLPPSLKVAPDMSTRLLPDGTYQNWFNQGLLDLASSVTVFPDEEVEAALAVVTARYAKAFALAGACFPLEERESLNGVAGVRFLDAFKRKTGQGLPTRGPKTNRIVEISGTRYYTSEARDCLQFVADNLAQFRNPGIFGDFTLKDEPKKLHKAVRVFTQFPFAFNDIMRRLCLPVFKILQDNPLLFGISIGMNADSFQWGQLYDKHITYDKHVFFDFTQFDKSHSASTMSASNKLIFRLAALIYPTHHMVLGHPWQLLMCAGLSLITNPIYNVQNTLYQVSGSLGSGLFSTAVQNSLIQELILQMLWTKFTAKYPKYAGNGDSFVRYVVHDKYGDDGFLSTNAPEFDLRFIIETAKDSWDMTITDPEKGDKIPENFPLEKWNYLKRGFRPVGDRVYAPLEIQSMLKTLNWWVPQDDKSVEDAMVDRCNEVMFYLSSHEDETWDEFSKIVHDAMCKVYGQRDFGGYFRTKVEVLASREEHYQDGFSKRPLTNFAKSFKMDSVEFARKFWLDELN